jgi:hypothetical protein
MKQYALTESNFNRILLMCAPLNCRFCGGALNVGDLIVSITQTHHRRSKHYHLECYLKTLH